MFSLQSMEISQIMRHLRFNIYFNSYFDQISKESKVMPTIKIYKQFMIWLVDETLTIE